MPYHKRRSSKKSSSTPAHVKSDFNARSSGLFEFQTSIASHSRRLIVLLLGIWFGGILFTALFVPFTFQTVDATLASPSPAATKLIQQNSVPELRAVLRQGVSEMNRLLFFVWSTLQTGFSVLLFAYLLFGTSSERLPLGLAGGMLGLCLLMSIVLVPRMSNISYDLDRATGAQALSYQQSFNLLHRGFAAFQSAIVLLGVLLLLLVLRRGPRRPALAAATPAPAPEAPPGEGAVAPH